MKITIEFPTDSVQGIKETLDSQARRFRFSAMTAKTVQAKAAFAAKEQFFQSAYDAICDKENAERYADKIIEAGKAPKPV